MNTILLLHKDDEDIDLVKTTLTKCGFAVQCTEDLLQAYKSVMSGKISCVILDLDSIEDVTTLVHIMHVFHTIPIIWLSSIYDEYCNPMINNCQVEVLPRLTNGLPFDVDLLAKIITTHIEVPEIENDLKLITTQLEIAERYIKGDCNGTNNTVLEFKEFAKLSAKATRKHPNK